MRILRNFYLTKIFFIALIGIITLFLFSYAIPVLLLLVQASATGLLAVAGLDTFILFSNKRSVLAKRRHAKILSLGDENIVTISLSSGFNFKIYGTLIDELPKELQIRDFKIHLILPAHTRNRSIAYPLKPLSRGLYKFGSINFFIKSPLALVERRIIIPAKESVPVFPSVIQMKNFELNAVTSISNYQGVKKIRKIGHSYEFEQIKQYIPGDDPRSINWNASSRSSELMVNQYEDERSQPIYCLIDKSRTMRMPFNGLSLLDYAINTSLVISNIVLRKHDRAGLLTFSNKLGNFIKAERHGKQLNKILQCLYNEKATWPEADYELLYSAARNFIKGRSLLFLFTNFESVYALERVLPLLRKLNKLHLVVVMYFEDSELKKFCKQNCEDLVDIYHQTAAKELVSHKSRIEQTFQMHGIQCIKTKPENLSLDAVNKYLELKARGYI